MKCPNCGEEIRPDELRVLVYENDQTVGCPIEWGGYRYLDCWPVCVHCLEREKRKDDMHRWWGEKRLGTLIPNIPEKFMDAWEGRYSEPDPMELAKEELERRDENVTSI